MFNCSRRQHCRRNVKDSACIGKEVFWLHYEIYIDTLFLLNFGMNLYLLELTNCILHHTATWRRVTLGAFSGGVFSVLPYFWPESFAAAGIVGLFISVLCMSVITFPATGLGAYIRVLEMLSVLTIILGTFLLYILKKMPDSLHLPLLTVLLAGGFCFVIIRHILQQKNHKSYECKVTLLNGTTRIKINAFVDTGNSLIEPISGHPVAVLDKSIFDKLFYEESPGGFRVIPYRTIDKKAGLLPGYLIPEIHIEWNGFSKQFRNVYVGIRQQGMAEQERYKMIINPEMLKERKIS